MAEAKNTDREIWRREDNYYSPSIHVTADGGIGINCGGLVFVKSAEGWHALARDMEGKAVISADGLESLAECVKDLRRYAQEVGPLHGAWDDIFEAEKALGAAKIAK